MTVIAALPTAWDVKTAANQGAVLQGQAPVSAFERLLAPNAQLSAEDLGSVSWTVRAEKREAVPSEASRVAGASGVQWWVHVQAQAKLEAQCQRCLGPMAQAVAVDQWFRVVADEAQAALEDADSDEDVLGLDKGRLDLQAVLEDELLMAMPLVPMHEVCPTAVSFVATPVEVDEAVDLAPHPFAVLAQLKTPKA